MRSPKGIASNMIQILNGGMLSLMISIGHKTGLFDVISRLQPSTSDEIALATNLNERYIKNEPRKIEDLSLTY